MTDADWEDKVDEIVEQLEQIGQGFLNGAATFKQQRDMISVATCNQVMHQFAAILGEYRNDCLHIADETFDLAQAWFEQDMPVDELLKEEGEDGS